jgi:hypothetical protein
MLGRIVWWIRYCAGNDPTERLDFALFCIAVIQLKQLFMVKHSETRLESLLPGRHGKVTLG